MPPRPAKRLLLIGWDAADWRMIDPLLARGAMPALGRLLAAGLRADLMSLEPRLSPLLWTSIATGKTADKHGILNFVEPDAAGGVRIAASTSRKTKALWNILSQRALRTNVVSWYASHPAEPIRGVCISNLFQENPPAAPRDPWPLPPGAVHPAELGDTIARARLHPAAELPAAFRAVMPRSRDLPAGDRRPVILRKLLTRCASVHSAARAAMLGGDWDCTMVFYDAIDAIGHHFMPYHPPRMPHIPARDFAIFRHVMEATYIMHDAMLAELVELAGPDATVMLLSDHGFFSDGARPAAPPAQNEEHAAMDATWHRPIGVLAMAGPGVRRGGRALNATLLDITPTALTLLGLPVGADMDGRILAEAIDGSPRPDPVPGWDDIDGPAGLHPPELRLDPLDVGEAIAQLVELGYLARPTGDEQATLDLVRRETRFNLAVVYMTTGRPAEATPIFEELRRGRPDEPRYAMSLARCYAEQARFADAHATLEALLLTNPGHVEARLQRSGILFTEGRLEEAAAALKSLRAQAPPDLMVEVNCLFGLVSIFLHRPADAHAAFSKAAAADPRFPQAHHGLALAALGREHFEEAARHCLTALDLRPAFAEAHATLGAALAWLGDLDRAVMSFEVATSLHPGQVDAHRFLAAIHRHRGDAPGAARHGRIAGDLARSLAGGRLPESPMGPLEWERRFAKSPRGGRA